MSPRDSFWFLAGVLVAVAIMVTLRAWLRERPASGVSPAGPAEGATGRPVEATANIPADGPDTRPKARPTIPSFAVPVAAGLALVGVALGIYFLLGSPDSIASSNPGAATQPPHDIQTQQPSPTAGSLDDVTNKLAARLAAQGGSDNDWKLLAESYEYMGRTAEANAARGHVASAAAMAASASDSTAAQPTGDQIADIANALDKPHAVATANTAAGQWSSGAAPAPSQRAGDANPATASATSNSGASQHTAAPGAGTAAPASANAARSAWPANTANAANAASAAHSASANDSSGGSAGASGNAQISGTVNITSQLARQAAAGATLFIYAKQPDAPGPPLAVLRVRAEHWPVSFTLSDGNAMVPGRNLSNANTVQIEARISKNGDALPQSGDLVGSVTSVNPRDGHPVKISIDREIG